MPCPSSSRSRSRRRWASSRRSTLAGASRRCRGRTKARSAPWNTRRSAIRATSELGLLDATPIKVKGQEIVPRDAFIAAVSPKLTKPEARDLVALRVEVRGKNGKRVAWQLLDYSDEAHGISAMMRTTGYSLAIIGMMQVDGRVRALGVQTPDEAVTFGDYVSELAKRGVEIREI
ncbi:MAG: hypothetical protein DMD67_15575 [Gemmatimonadetes bacterium]|nr:MAG: hypothetical protein DMD67_15575 [Gemmatimonadota bacterium]